MIALLAALLLVQDDEAMFKERLARRKADSTTRLAERRREMEDKLKAEREEAAALRARLSKKPVRLALRGGVVHDKAIMTGFTLTDVDITVTGLNVTLPWDTLTPESLLAAADVLYDDMDSADAQFKRGRFLLARRLFGDARTAFKRAAAIDTDREEQVEEILEPIEELIAGKGGFKGAVKRTGSERVDLTYDWSDEEQLEDWDGVLKVDEGKATLKGEDEAHAYFSSLQFKGQAWLEAKVTSDGPVSVYLMLSRLTHWEAVIASDGVTLHRKDTLSKSPWDRGRQVAKGTVTRPTDAPFTLRVALANKKLIVNVNGRDVLTHPITGEPETGFVALAIKKGLATFSAPLVVGGTVDGRELDKKYAEVEVRARRAVDPDLRQVEKDRESYMAKRLVGSGEQFRLSADDPFFVVRHMAKEVMRYDELKSRLAEYISNNSYEKEVQTTLDELVKQYPSVPSLYYLRACFYWDRKELTHAQADLKKAIELFPDFVEAHVLQGEVHDFVGDYDLALAAAERAIAIRPDYAEAYQVRAEAGYSTDPTKIDRWMDDLRLASHLRHENIEAELMLRGMRYQRRGPRDLGCRFEHESKHYIVVTDISAEASKAYAERLEIVYTFFADVCKKWYAEKPFRKPRVAIFNTRENYYTYFELLNLDRGEQTAGVFMPRWSELLLFEEPDVSKSNSTLYHEAFHHFTRLMTKQTPPYWWNEGIAEYLSEIRIKDGKVVEKGLVNKDRLPYLQAHVRAGQALRFSDIMTQTPAQFYSGDLQLKYAQAWAMLHFFYEYDKGRHRPLIEAYFEAMREGKTLQECYEAVFKDKVTALEKEWTEHVKGLK